MLEELSRISPRVAGTDNCVHVMIEMTVQDGLKYEFNRDTGLMFVDRPLYANVQPPLAYGFIPNTVCGPNVAALSTHEIADGFSLDAFVLSDRPIFHHGVIAQVRVIGGIPVTDQGQSDDKIIGVLANDPAYSSIDNIDDLPSRILDKVCFYLISCNPDTNVYVGEPYGLQLANERIDAAISDFSSA